MPSIRELEIKNLPKEFKENLYNRLKANPNSKIKLSEDWEKTGNLEALDKALDDYFFHHYDMFWYFIKRYKNSLYNQYSGKWWYWKPRLLRHYIKFKSSSTYIKFKSITSSSGWKTFWKVFYIITFPIQLVFFIIAMFLRYIVAPFIAGLLWWLGKWILIFLVAGGIMAGIAHLLMYIFS
ncbi:hypothetical protein R7V45_02230 [Mesomycoplasma ovipneumoniae]|uniref:Uncharacterized protein n=1 Tax=Mesomycoplasma ovipneumoniae TaxID=29562 RepID=A0AAJ2P4R9_9BACT|nr:hypothetical protein [Mesomycoplasma ovipneumoniae]MDW2829995.1 hypothetical protein [Mesomycoplasma ovipneumoniae]MDW2870952.1 hypothetical protein [Mesomycoplasma ovipneumoniae]MDW2891772.1 hypothetical protein [Mesomycoplasma ovipneumoniae]MDW2893330.1 hypothetical protein [Mesomycoplasma ovipneumoniae]MDW2898314.1 hypothetical protein [Mesomycoplasma ovipneumoniae]